MSGVIGAIDLVKGQSSSSGSVTVVGEGPAEISVELPLSVRSLVKVGQEVSVQPIGASSSLTGEITQIAALETSGTSGDDPTYTTTVKADDDDSLLLDGSRASVTFTTKTSSDVLVVPVSAVTPTGDNAGTVSVLSAGIAEPSTVQVKTGAVGGGYIEITDGLQVGQEVVLADKETPLPSNG
ncbi:MAG: hypothetical protein LBR32_06980 [Propionibacteriaceae bacterium]|nr:hypothetical protein [Propionibacteriaceae bacterium]